MPENGPIPDASLFDDNPSVVKLHGGTFGLRVGESLDVPLDEANLTRFVDYFPNDALVLVIGYGGADRRVMSLIDRLALNHDYKKLKVPKILWVYRDSVPNSVSQAAQLASNSGTVSVVRYRSGGLFLRELHARLVGLHPASRTPYPSLEMVPPFEEDPDRGHRREGAATLRVATDAAKPTLRVLEDDSARLIQSVTIYACYKAGSGTTSRLAAHVRNVDASHQSIWCALAEIPTLRALVAMLLDQIRHYDTSVTPKTLVLPPGKHEKALRKKALAALKAEAPSAQNFDDALGIAEQIARPLANQLVYALRRGKYVVSLDSAGEFGRHDFAHSVYDRRFKSHMKEALWQSLLLYAFLRCIAGNKGGSGALDQLGESKLCVALTPLEATKVVPQALPLFDYVVSQLNYIACDIVGPAAPKAGQSAYLTTVLERALAGGKLKRNAHVKALISDAKMKIQKLEGDTPRLLEVTTHTLYEVMICRANTRSKTAVPEPAYRALLTIASTFRRPRSIINLRHLADRFEIFSNLSREQADMQFDQIMNDLNQFRLLINLEGGFYWMHNQTRDFIYRSMLWDRGVLEVRRAEIHEAIADEYTDLLRQSDSLPSLYEAAYHLVAASREPGFENREDRSRLIRKVRALLKQTSATLVMGSPSRVVVWIRALASQLDCFLPPLGGHRAQNQVADATRNLRGQLHELRARVYFLVTDFETSLAIRRKQLAPPRSAQKAGGNARPRFGPGTLLRRAVLHKEIGRCLSGRLEFANARESLEKATRISVRVSRRLRKTRTPNQQVLELREATEIQSECQLALADLSLRQVQHWNWQRRPPPDVLVSPPGALVRIKEAEGCSQELGKILQMPCDLSSAVFPHLHSSQLLLEARLLTLQGTFPNRALDEAQAAVFAGHGAGDNDDLTDIRLQAAESLILAAALLADGNKAPRIYA